jgi:hypothetical protein
MSGSPLCPFRRRCLFALAAAVTFTGLLPAQTQPEANIRSITRYRLKPERAADFRSIVKDINAVRKKAGDNRGRTWWQSLSGPAELVVVAYYSKWAELDTPDAAAKEAAADLAPLQARAMQCVNGVDRILDTVLPEFSLPRTPDNIPAYVSNLRVVVKHDRIAEYLAAQKSDMFPAIQKSGLKTATFARTRYGGPNTEFRRSIGLKGWSDLDAPSVLTAGMGGEAAYEKYLAKIRPLVLETELTIYRHVAELDYLPGK